MCTSKSLKLCRPPVFSPSKIVRISNKPPLVYPVMSIDEHTEEEIAARWWSRCECEGIHLNARYIAAAAKKCSLIVKKLETTYLYVQEELFNCDQNQMHELMFCPPKALTEHLEKWSSTAHSARGLEGWISVEQHVRRTFDARNARDLVFELYFNRDFSDSDIAVIYAEYAKSSALYARAAGYADQVALQKLQQK